MEKLVRKVQKRFKVEIPKDIREYLGIKEGQPITIELEGDGIVIKKIYLD